MIISTLKHPVYLSRLTDYFKWRLTYEGGRQFIDRYLKKFSNREDHQDFVDRKAITYCPAFAKSGVNEVKNSIYQRMTDITRVGGSDNYDHAVEGLGGGVDRKGNSMNSFIGQDVLTELLILGKVGVFVDMPVLPGNSIAATQGHRPYLYTYTAENIQNWIIENDEYQSVLLTEEAYTYDKDTGFPTGTETRYRHIWRADGVVKVQFYSSTNKEIGETQILDLDRIPFVMFEISNSLLVDVCDYQIALMNLASSDIAYTLKANFPFYVEQFDPRAEGSSYIRSNIEPEYDANGNLINEGTAESAGKAGEQEVAIGPATGRRYPIGMEQPNFINPSSEPMKASMEKQEQLKKEIRLLLDLGLNNIKAVGMASAESKKEDSRSLEAGLSSIGLTLEKGEREIADIWTQYEGSSSITIKYPVNYSLRSEEDRRDEAEALDKVMKALPSKTYQKEVGKQIARVMLSHYISTDTLNQIDDEIEKSPNMVSDPETVAKDVENGLVSPETASQLRGYPDGESGKAEEAHTRRLTRIAAAQSSGPRGVSDLDPDPQKSGKEEKKESRQTDQDDVVRDKTRGKAK